MIQLWPRWTGWVVMTGLLWGTAAEGQLYRWTAYDGVVHYTDAPVASPGLSLEAVPGTEGEAPPALIAPAPFSAEIRAAAVPVAGVPPEVVAAVENLAQRLHPGDHAAQSVVVRQQLDAWRALQGYAAADIPSALLASFFSAARGENPYDYVAQKYSVDVQVAAYRQGGGRSAEPSPLPPAMPSAGPYDDGANRIIENTTIIYPPRPSYHHHPPAPAAPKPYILYHPGPNAPRFGKTPDPVVLMPPGWTPLAEEPPLERSDPPPPRPARSGSAKLGGSP